MTDFNLFARRRGGRCATATSRMRATPASRDAMLYCFHDVSGYAAALQQVAAKGTCPARPISTNDRVTSGGRNCWRGRDDD